MSAMPLLLIYRDGCVKCTYLHCGSCSCMGCTYSLDWTTGLDYWTGLLDWTTGLTFGLILGVVRKLINNS